MMKVGALMKKSDRRQRYKGFPAPVARRNPLSDILNRMEYARPDEVRAPAVTAEIGTPSTQVVPIDAQDFDKAAGVLGNTVRSMSVQRAGRPVDGLALRMLGAEVTPRQLMGYWGGHTAPLAHYSFPVETPTEGVDAFANAIGLMTAQDAVGYNIPGRGETPMDVVAIRRDARGAMSPELFERAARLVEDVSGGNAAFIADPTGGRIAYFTPEARDAVRPQIDALLDGSLGEGNYNVFEGTAITGLAGYGDGNVWGRPGSDSRREYVRGLTRHMMQGGDLSLTRMLRGLTADHTARLRAAYGDNAVNGPLVDGPLFAGSEDLQPRINLETGPQIAPLIEAGDDAQRAIYGLFGEIDPSRNTTSELKIYGLGDLIDSGRADDIATQYGADIKTFNYDVNDYRVPNLKHHNYGTGTAWIYDPSVEAGSFKDEAYTRAWRTSHEIAHGIAEPIIESMFGPSRREGRLGRTMMVPRRHREVEARPLTLMEAQRAVAWEDLTFRIQREILKRFGVTIDDVDFNREYNTNLGDAVYRSATGKFGDPGDRGFIPADERGSVVDAMSLLSDMEDYIARGQGRAPTQGINLDSYVSLSDADVAAIERLAADRMTMQPGGGGVDALIASIRERERAARSVLSGMGRQ